MVTTNSRGCTHRPANCANTIRDKIPDTKSKRSKGGGGIDGVDWLGGNGGGKDRGSHKSCRRNTRALRHRRVSRRRPRTDSTGTTQTLGVCDGDTAPGSRKEVADRGVGENDGLRVLEAVGGEDAKFLKEKVDDDSGVDGVGED